jgi:hypothetical protein
MYIGYGIDPLRDEAPLHAASTPAAEAVLAAGYRNDVGESNEAMACTPRLGLQQGFVVGLSGRCGIAENLIPSLRTEIGLKAPYGGQIKAEFYGRGCFTYPLISESRCPCLFCAQSENAQDIPSHLDQKFSRRPSALRKNGERTNLFSS